ncbi:MAG: hypothetical protein AAFY60_03025, partial [Myxococcota bacterium]
SGLSVLVELGPGTPAEQVAKHAERIGIGIVPLNRYCESAGTGRNALVIGYAEPTLEQIEEGLVEVFSGTRS